MERIEGKRAVLIGGEQLPGPMIEHGVGLTTTKLSELKEVSNDLFGEDEA